MLYYHVTWLSILSKCETLKRGLESTITVAPSDQPTEI